MFRLGTPILTLDDEKGWTTSERTSLWTHDTDLDDSLLPSMVRSTGRVDVSYLKDVVPLPLLSSLGTVLTVSECEKNDSTSSKRLVYKKLNNVRDTSQRSLK